MFKVILATDEKDGLGLNGSIPWLETDDLRYFAKCTADSAVVVGRKTAECLPELRGRTLFCVSSDTGAAQEKWWRPNMTLCSSVDKALYAAQATGKKVWVIGGGSIYSYVFDYLVGKIEEIHWTRIPGDYKCDTQAPHIPPEFVIHETVKHPKSPHLDTFILRRSESGERQYLELLRRIKEDGVTRVGRNGGTTSVFVHHMKFDLRDGFPLLTTRKMFMRGIVEELLFFLRGDTDSKILEKNRVNIWKGNTSREFLDSLGFTERREGVMGPLYGYQWRHFNVPYDESTAGPTAVSKDRDQLARVVWQIKNNPSSRRILMTSYNPEQLPQCVLPPCHSVVLQFFVQGEYLDMFCFNRSQDVMLGTPFNIASSSLLLHIISKLTGLTARYFHLSMGDAHIYEPHSEAADVQLQRTPYKFPTLRMPEMKSLDDIPRLKAEDFIVEGYKHYPGIRMSMVA